MTFADQDGGQARLNVETLEGREAPGGWGSWDWASSWRGRSNWGNSRDWSSCGRSSPDNSDNNKACDPAPVRSCGRYESPTRSCTPTPPPTCNPPPVANSLIGGFAYLDADRDGFFSTGDTLLPNVAVTLTGTTAGGVAVNTPATTDANGGYNFGGLAAGTYTVTATPPGDLLTGHSSAGTFGGTPGDNTVTGIAVVAGQSSAGYNFGFEEPRPR